MTQQQISYPHLFTPIKIGPHTIPNRIMMGSMHLGLEEHPNGFSRMAEFYAERVRGGTKLLVTGGISPNNEGALDVGGASMQTSEDVAKHRLITDAVHAEGGLILLQLLHAGRYAKHADLVAPSPIQAPINRFAPREMTGDDIRQTISDYAAATSLALAAGYDGVEIMGSEGYLINTFLAPATNHRTDEWGGNASGRNRFAIEVTRAVRKALGSDKILSFRISIVDLVPNGCTGEELLALAGEIEGCGADMFVTGIGWHESRVPTIATSVPRAAFVDFTAKLTNQVSIPVAAANRINDPAVAEEILASGKSDLIAMARPLLADPAFAAKAEKGQAERINTCIACNQACLDHIFAGRLASCLVNPRGGNETELILTPTRIKKSVAVVGGGVAGLSAALAARERGLDVTVFEVRESLGGQFDMAMRIPGKEEFKHTLRYYEGELRRLGCTIKLGHHATAAELASFDEVIVATGVKPRVPEIKGIDLPLVATYAQILRGEREAGETVVILGAGGIGFDTAEFLTQKGESNSLSPELFKESWGVIEDPQTRGNVTRPQLEASPRKVTMIQRKSTKAGAGLGLTTGWIHKAEIDRRGVKTIVGAGYDEITNDGIKITVDGQQQFIAADTIVLCTGQESVAAIHTELIENGINAHLIGGAKLAGELDAKRAIYEGVEVAASL